jgi:hypothetical protein
MASMKKGGIRNLDAVEVNARFLCLLWFVQGHADPLPYQYSP